MGEPKKTIELNIPRTAEERAKASNEWHCAGCGAPVPDLVKRCDCATMVACKEGFKSSWMIDPNEPPCVINIRNCQTQLDADGCQVGVSRQALEETLADYSRLRSEVERLTKERNGAFLPTDADDYWKNAIGGPYTPRKLRKHEAANAATIRRVIQDAPDECADVIASLVFFSCAATEREKFLVGDANSRAQSAEAALTGIREVSRSVTAKQAAMEAAADAWNSDQSDEKMELCSALSDEFWAAFDALCALLETTNKGGEDGEAK